MRSSTIKTDPGYNPDARCAGYVITVDGHVVRDCHTADEETGEAWCYVRNAQGVFEVDETGQAIRAICHRGKVVITPRVAHESHE